MTSGDIKAVRAHWEELKPWAPLFFFMGRNLWLVHAVVAMGVMLFINWFVMDHLTGCRCGMENMWMIAKVYLFPVFFMVFAGIRGAIVTMKAKKRLWKKITISGISCSWTEMTEIIK